MSGIIVCSEDPEAMSRFFREVVNRIMKPLAERISQEEEKLGRRLTKQELDVLIREVCENALEEMKDGQK